ncbi:DotU family type IV/VI secretion system protein [Rubrivivax gelatinosus]|uniref:Type VI secretion system protein ImpK n=1 Tax=Rubrivivax gelatinosus TaxID=28068 RepID=A0A4R2M6M0_RUBGE|nr:DotU family type IV/VI secretion system protein [Rubrivivax gelatinosus]MBK1687547.1 type VI secretion protein [Rubrivivax gelatinosus]TCP02919.1 type VI secretion system protein ImpK [Rubrivivax gelatinosus]
MDAGTAEAVASPPGRDLLDLLHEGFYALLLVRRGCGPADGTAFRRALCDWLGGVQAQARRLGLDAEDVRLACFAFAALADELALGTPGPLREAWLQRPLQHELFDETLAGERFFEHLERLREQGPRHLAVLEVFRMCLLLGYQGRYAFQPPEARSWLLQRLGDEILRWRGGRAPFAPRAQAPDHVVHRLRRQVPGWAVAAVLAGLVLLAWAGLHLHLVHRTEHELAQVPAVVQPLPEPARLTVTWP